MPHLVGIETLAGDLGHADDSLGPCAEDPSETPAADCRFHTGIDADHDLAATVAVAAVAVGLGMDAADHDVAAAGAAAGHGSRNPALTEEDQ